MNLVPIASNCQPPARYLPPERRVMKEGERRSSTPPLPTSSYPAWRTPARLWHGRACIRGDNANRNKHLAAREWHVATGIYYIPTAHTLDGRLKGCFYARKNHDRDNDGTFLPSVFPSIAYLVLVTLRRCNVPCHRSVHIVNVVCTQLEDKGDAS